MKLSATKTLLNPPDDDEPTFDATLTLSRSEIIDIVGICRAFAEKSEEFYNIAPAVDLARSFDAILKRGDAAVRDARHSKDPA